MPAFAVRVIDRMGNRRSLREAAPDLAGLRRKLRENALWPVRIREIRAQSRHARLVLPTRELVGLLQQLELQLRAGVTADAALGQLASDAPVGPMRVLLRTIHEEVARGTPIHVACRAFVRVFPPHLAAVIAAGEASARLPEALQALASHIKGSADLKRTARRALVYPTLVLTATLGLVVLLMGKVVPQFAAMFASLNIELPLLTQILIRASSFADEKWPLVLSTLGAMSVVGIYVAAAPGIRGVRDAFLLNIPVFGDVVRHLATARFAANCRLLYDAGISVLDALEIGAELTGNVVMARTLRAARDKVAVGEPLYASFPKNGTFPRFVIPALKSGETTGQLGAALRHIEEFASVHARERLALALSLVEPLLLVGLTGVVGTIALSFFLPLFSLLGGIR